MNRFAVTLDSVVIVSRQTKFQAETNFKRMPGICFCKE